MAPRGLEVTVMEEQTVLMRDWRNNERGDGDPPLIRVQQLVARSGEKTRAMFPRELTDEHGNFRYPAP